MQDFKMPAWNPGYYRIMDYEKFVSGFTAADGAGHELPWEKVTKNTWRVVTAGASAVVVNYDVFGNVSFAAQNFLGEARAYLAPPGLYMYVAGQLAHPASVTFEMPAGWSTIATGLDAVAGRPHTFTASNFDILFDSPVLAGSQELLRFDVKGVVHDVAIENVPASVDRQKMIADLRKMVETATGLMGDLPYKHYAFLMMGTGNGGIEHLNSASIAFNGNSLTSDAGYRRWLSYVAHEYFHNFNVKRIRPIALGPFDYDSENLTNMLWVSEGLSVYYQDLIVERAGLWTRDQYLEAMQSAIASFENASGHHYQSATDSSLHTWGSSGVGNDRNTTISYYNNGGMLGAMLDLAIRNASENRKSLDDVMRGLYRKYYQQKQRGFTDAEFRQECEAAAGAPLAEIFVYAATTKDVDYAKYFAYAGLVLTADSQDAPGASLGANLQTLENGKLVVVQGAAPLHPGDEILEVEGAKATPKAINDALAAKKPGDSLRFKINRDGAPQEAAVTLGKNSKRTFTLKPAGNPTPLQSAILKGWLL
jgi:predicted metalloprotease with PDZ domain